MAHSRDLLVITPTPSHPKDAGNRKRIYSLFKYLQSRSFKIHYVLYNTSNNKSLCNESNYQAMKEEWDYFDLVLPSSDSWKILQKIKTKILYSSQYSAMISRGIHLPVQYNVDDWCSDALIKFVDWKCSNFSISTVFVEYVFLSKVLDYLPENIFKVIDTHDVFANRHSLLSKSAVNSKFFTTSPQQEIKGLNRADLVIAIQEEEKKYFADRINPEVIELTHIEAKKNNKLKKYSALNSIGLIASSNDINVHSIQKFLTLVAKKKSLSSLKIYIGGKGSLKIIHSSSNVIVLGQVDDLNDFYDIADLYVNPMIAGTGLKIKTIEAFSYNVPFLSTTFGSVGIGSNFEFHNFQELEQLVDHLEQLYLNQNSLELYQEASQSCFYTYELSLKLQLETLVARLEERAPNSA